MKYVIKTQFGLSTQYIQSSPGATLFGTGQGSGAAPAVWLTISTILLASLKKLVTRGMVFSTPSASIKVDKMVSTTQGFRNPGLCLHSLPSLKIYRRNGKSSSSVVVVL
jgi:hypothetical protein